MKKIQLHKENNQQESITFVECRYAMIVAAEFDDSVSPRTQMVRMTRQLG